MPRKESLTGQKERQLRKQAKERQKNSEDSIFSEYYTIHVESAQKNSEETALKIINRTEEDTTLQSVESMANHQSSDTDSNVNIMDSDSDSTSSSHEVSDSVSQDSVDIMTCQSVAESNSYIAEEPLQSLEKRRERQQSYRENRDKLRELKAQERSQLIAKLRSFVYSDTDNLDVSSEGITEDLITQSLDVSSLKEIKNMLSERQKRAQKRKEYQQRYRERHRERLRLRARERRRQLRGRSEHERGGSRQNCVISCEASRMSTSCSAEDPMGILIEVPKRASDKSLTLKEKMEKKWERQRRYRERHREILRLRERERRRLLRTISGSCRKSTKNSNTGSIKSDVKDYEMITNTVSSVGVEHSRTIEIEIPMRSEEETILPDFLDREPVSPVQSRRRKERNKKTRKRRLDQCAEDDGMSENALNEQNCMSKEETIVPHFLEQEPVSPGQSRTRKERNKNTRKRRLNHCAEVDGASENALSEAAREYNCINERVQTNAKGHVFETTQKNLNDNFECSYFGHTSAICNGLGLKRSPAPDEIISTTHPVQVTIKLEDIKCEPSLDGEGTLEDDLYTDPIAPYKMENADPGPPENRAEHEHVYIKTEMDPEEAPDLQDFI